MSEIEKLMQNAGIKKVRQTNIAGGDYPIAVGFEDYPPFTAEKQLKLIKWLGKICELSICWNDISKSFQFIIRTMCNGAINRSICGNETSFEDDLAYLVNSIWLVLTDTEKAEIKEILK